MKKILVAGGTGYLGKYLLKALKKEGYSTIALARNAKKLDRVAVDGIIKAEVTQPDTLKGISKEIDCIISTIGITRQKDGLTYMDVDYKANLNLMNEAKKAGIKKFVYVSVLNGRYMKNLKMVEAKERFVDELKSSGMDYIINRPNGFFSDMTEILEMAKKGKVYLFGKGEHKGNPIHGEDLAEFIINHLAESNTELEVGGPEVLTQNEIAQIAFKAIGKLPKISHIPDWVRKLILGLTRVFTSQKVYGPIEFFMTVMARDMIAPQVGTMRIKDFFLKESQNY